MRRGGIRGIRALQDMPVAFWGEDHRFSIGLGGCSHPRRLRVAANQLTKENAMKVKSFTIGLFGGVERAMSCLDEKVNTFLSQLPGHPVIHSVTDVLVKEDIMLRVLVYSLK